MHTAVWLLGKVWTTQHVVSPQHCSVFYFWMQQTSAFSCLLATRQDLQDAHLQSCLVSPLSKTCDSMLQHVVTLIAYFNAAVPDAWSLLFKVRLCVSVQMHSCVYRHKRACLSRCDAPPASCWVLLDLQAISNQPFALSTR